MITRFPCTRTTLASWWLLRKSWLITTGRNLGKAAKEVKHGTVHLEPGVHPVTLTYLNARQQRDPQRQDATARGLHVGFPKEFVRSLTAGDIASIRLQAGALLAEGKREEAKALLIKLHRGGWPLSDKEQEQRGAGTDADSAHGQERSAATTARMP